jgi:hypothetical protein
MIKFDVLSRFTDKVKFTAEIECGEDTPRSVKLGLVVKWGVENNADLNNADLRNADLRNANLRNADLRNADLRNADLWNANLSDADLRNANLRNANLRNADLWNADLWNANLSDANLWNADLWNANLWNASGLNDYVKCIQIDTYAIAYTSDVMQIGCERHTISEWAEFDDKRILEMDGKTALKWWRKYKSWIFQTIELRPAKPTGTIVPIEKE